MPESTLPPPWDRFVPFVQRVFVWSLVFGVLWLLRPFFFLVFLTFVFGYILEHFVQRTEGRIRSRRLRVVTGFLGLLFSLVGIGFYLAPALAQQAKQFPSQIKANLNKVDEFIEELRRDSPTLDELLPKDLKAARVVAELFGIEQSSAPQVALPPSDAAPELALSIAVRDLAIAVREGLEAAVEPDGERRDQIRAALERVEFVAQSLPKAIERRPVVQNPFGGEPERWKDVLPLIVSVAESSVAIGSAFLLSLLFSFLIVLDFPNLAAGARHLHDTRLQFVYDEISDSVFHFGRVLGQALEAQLMIAIVNTTLTAIGLWIMDLPNIVFLSMIVFVCSFIPVAGVFISSVPICLTALTVGDVQLMMFAIGFITIIHMIEAYILNPRIYGAHMRMNPVLVLAILVISHHLFGMWGLILGVPVVNYFVKYVIEGKQRRTGELEAAA